MQAYEALDPWSFTSYMQSAKDSKRHSDGRLKGAVDWRVHKATIWLSVADARLYLENVSEARIKVLAASGRIPGSKHRGRAWCIPGTRQRDGSYRVEVTGRSKGPKPRFQVTSELDRADSVPF